MTDKPKRLNILGALGDFTILLLLIAGAGFAGYYIGLNQRLAPVQMVWPGTPGAIPLSQILGPQPMPFTPDASTSSAANPSAAAATPVPGASTDSEPAKTAAAPEAPKPAAKKKTKFWLCSSGADGYVGYSITAKVNGVTVDNFFGAGKTIDITSHVKKGANTLELESKYMGEDYNNHKDDAAAVLNVQLVSGPSIREDFAPSAVLFSVKRNATETTDYTEKKTFQSAE